MKGKTTASKIKETIIKIGELQAVKRHYNSTMEEMNNVLSSKEKIETKMIKELEDINKLEKLGVKSIFYNVLGSKEQQLEKERQEYLQVTLQHKEMVNALELIEFEKNILEKKLVTIDDLEKELEELKEVREQEILASPGGLKNELSLIYNKIDNRQKFKAELSEAFIVGKQTYESLKIVYKHMNNAMNWGDWDRSGGRNGRFQKITKYNAIDKAMNEVSRSKLLLRNFNKELTDVGYSNLRLALQVENINSIPAIIFDNLISDWIITKKIHSVLSTVDTLIEDVRSIMETMLKDKTDNEDELIVLNQQKDHLLEEN